MNRARPSHRIQTEGFRSLAEGQKGEFDVERGPEGLQAENLRPLSWPRRPWRHAGPVS
jgi:'Cold-shock' DNA-binding domain